MIKHNAILEVSLKNLAYNYNKLSSIANQSVCAATIKADAYGIGVIKTFETLYKNKCRHFFVATTEEALEIRDKKLLANVYVLNGLENNQLSIFNKSFAFSPSLLRPVSICIPNFNFLYFFIFLLTKLYSSLSLIIGIILLLLKIDN